MRPRVLVCVCSDSVNPCQKLFEQSTEIETFIDWPKSELNSQTQKTKVNEPNSTLLLSFFNQNASELLDRFSI